MANLFDMKGGKMFAVLSKIAERLPPEVGDAILEDDEAVLKALVSGAMSASRFTLIHGLFTPVEKQIALVREWNAVRGWGFTDDDFVEAEKSIPKWPDGKLVAVNLVPYLPEAKVDPVDLAIAMACLENDIRHIHGVERTFQELWSIAACRQEASWRWDGYDNAGPDKLRLLEGIVHPAKDKPILRWEVIDFGCNRNRNPIDVRNPQGSPHAGILAAAALHPEWIKAMDGDNVPYVLASGYEASGYEVDVSGRDPWQGVPSVDFDRDDCEIRLTYDWYDYCSSRWSVPLLVRE